MAFPDENRAKRLKQARLEAGYSSVRAFAETFGGNKYTVGQHENGTRGFNHATALKYARLLHVDYEWLQTGRGSPYGSMNGRHQLVGYVEAGAQVHPVKTATGIDINPPKDSYVAETLKVRGNDNYPAFRNGDTIYLKPKLLPISDATGSECYVKVVNGNHFLAELAPGSKKNHFTLVFHNKPPITDVKLEWAKPVHWIMRG